MAKNIRENLLFEGLKQEEVEEFLSSLPEPMRLKKGEMLWRQNDPGNSMHLLVSGKMEVLIKSKNTDDAVIAVIEAGAVIGEVCVFGQRIRSATVRAAADSELLVVDGQKFEQRILQRDTIALRMSYNVAKLLTHRLIMANDLISNLQKISDKTVVKSEVEHYRQRFFDESLFN
ncbi:MAG: cyclic nucleotide-binding domain-containing protein [Proteobacteria bacterium]|nr:cyclic nucleotide-binding domain-containing protein [Pseudomonadota bacterium]